MRLRRAIISSEKPATTGNRQPERNPGFTGLRQQRYTTL